MRSQRAEGRGGLCALDEDGKIKALSAVAGWFFPSDYICNDFTAIGVRTSLLVSALKSLSLFLSMTRVSAFVLTARAAHFGAVEN
jgi:hypothetical protein